MAKQARDKQPSDGPPDVPAARLHVWQVQAVRDLLVVAAVVGLFWTGYALRAVTVPLLVALMLAYLFEPLIQSLCERRKIKRTTAVGGVLAFIALVLVLIVVLLLPTIVIQGDALITSVREGDFRRNVEALEKWMPESMKDDFRDMIDVLPGESAAAAGTASATPDRGNEVEEGDVDVADPPGPITTDDAQTMIDRAIDARIDELQAAGDDGATASLSRDVRGWMQKIFGIIGGLVQFGLLLFLIPFYFFFFSVWYPAVVKFGRDLIPKKNRTRSLELFGKMDAVIAGFVRGRIVISLIMGAMLAIGWMISGVPHALLLGFVTGIFCAVPYLGVVGVPAAVAFLVLPQLGVRDPGMWILWACVWPSVVFAVVQLIEGYVLTPMIAGKVTNLDPVTILVAVLAGGSVLGVYGMLLAIPFAACAKILLTEVLLPQIKAWTRGEVKDPLPFDRE